jgi:hypothetical protein
VTHCSHQIPSLSPIRLPGEGNVGTLARILRYMDSNIHVQLVIEDAKLGDPDTLEWPEPDHQHRPDEVPRPGEGRHAGEEHPRRCTQIVGLPDGGWQPLHVATVQVDTVRYSALQSAQRLQTQNAQSAAPRTLALRAQLQVPAPEVSTALTSADLKTLGDHAGQLVDSVEGWTNAALSMDVKQQAALKASINVLTMQNGQSA